jgi:hypothetical protein
MKKDLIVTAWSAVSLIALIAVYVGSYFSIMAEGDTFNPDTYEREYRSYNRHIPSVRVTGPLSIYVTPSHWTNVLYYPMDRVLGRLHHSTDRQPSLQNKEAAQAAPKQPQAADQPR